VQNEASCIFWFVLENDQCQTRSHFQFFFFISIPQPPHGRHKDLAALQAHFLVEELFFDAPANELSFVAHLDPSSNHRVPIRLLYKNKSVCIGRP
jgi:hypothetical protein